MAKKKTNLAEAARQAGLPYGTVHHRVKKLGWSQKRALSTPVRQRKKPEVEEPTANPDLLRNILFGLCFAGLILAWVLST